MLIAQLSDLHVRPQGVLYQGVVDSNGMLANAIQHLHQLDKRPDLVLVTGDVVDHGTLAEYAHARELLSALEIPYLVIPGNHDHRGNFQQSFADHTYLPREGPMHYCVDEHPVRIIALDSCVPGLHHGDAGPDGLAWLASALAANQSKPTIVLLHHPPFMSGIPYMDKYRYLHPEPLADILSAHPNVELVLCGHVHRLMLKRWASTVVCACPSTTTEIALRLATNASPASYTGTPACMLHLWHPQHGMVSHLSSIGSFAGPFPFA